MYPTYSYVDSLLQVNDEFPNIREEAGEGNILTGLFKKKKNL